MLLPLYTPVQNGPCQSADPGQYYPLELGLWSLLDPHEKR